MPESKERSGHVGIDVGKTQLDAVVYESGAHFSALNDAAGAGTLSIATLAIQSKGSSSRPQASVLTYAKSLPGSTSQTGKSPRRSNGLMSAGTDAIF